MATRLLPYAGMSTPQIVMEVLGHGMRPPRPGSGCACPPELWQIMQECWQENRKLRPTFAQLVPRLEVRGGAAALRLLCAARCVVVVRGSLLAAWSSSSSMRARSFACHQSCLPLALTHQRIARAAPRAFSFPPLPFPPP